MVSLLILLSLTLTAPATQADDGNHGVKRTDDVSLSSLEVLVQQQATLIQSQQANLQALQNRIAAVESENTALNNKVTGVESKLTGVENKVAAQSRAVAFTVRFKADNASNGVAVGTHSALRFDAIILNTGNGYDPQTGFFAAPVAGTYAFFLTHMGAGAHGAVYLSIVKHGQILDLVYSKDHEDQGSSQVTAHLGAGEQVWVQHYQGDAVRGGWWTVFSGYLLQAD